MQSENLIFRYGGQYQNLSCIFYQINSINEGDTGGPIMLLHSSGRMTAVGMAVGTMDNQGSLTTPAYFVRLRQYHKFIQNHAPEACFITDDFYGKSCGKYTLSITFIKIINMKKMNEINV